MKTIIILSCMICLSPCITGQEFIDLYQNRPKEEPASKAEGGVTRITKVLNPRLQVFRPTAEKDNGNAMIVCPGGGYSILAIDKEGTEIASWLTTLGYTTFVLEYSVPQLKEKAYEDLRKSIEIVKNQKGFGDSSKLGIIGFSAGGHLTATVSTRSDAIKEDQPDFAVLIYPAYLDKGEDGGLSPEVELTENTIPMFIFVAADDPYAKSSVVMAGALQENQTSVEFHMYPEGGHGYGMREGIEAAETWPLLLEKWLKKR